MQIRAATAADLPALVELYNRYVEASPCTFDVQPFTVEARRPWLAQFADGGRYRLLVAEEDRLLGYAGSLRFRDKRAYETSIETTVYVAADQQGKGIATRLYSALFETLRGEDVHRALAGITLPNDPSIRLHERFEFRRVAHFTEQGRKFGKYWDVCWMEKAL
jgi:phosphinothricin acetyltransferase